MIEKILVQITELLIIFVIPGYILFTKYVGRNFRLDLEEFIFLCILGSILISGWIGLILAELGKFSLFNLLILLIIFIVCLVFIGISKINTNKLKFDYNLATLVIILLIAIALFFHPFPWIQGGRDPGAYINTGINIAKTGSIIIHDQFLRDLKGDSIDILYQMRDIRNGYEGTQFPGLYIVDKEEGMIIPQFLHLYPTWIAISYSIFNLENGLLWYITPFFGLLGVISVYFASRVMFNKTVGIIAAILLTFNFSQIWFSRYPTSEVLAQFLIFGGMYALVMFERTDNHYFGVISGLSFGEVFLTRIDAFLILLLIVLFLTYTWLEGRLKTYIYFIIPFCTLLIHSFIHSIYYATPYLFDVLQGMTNGMITLETSKMFVFYYKYHVILASILMLFFIITNRISMSKLRIYTYNKYKEYIKYMSFSGYILVIIFVLWIIYMYIIFPASDVDNPEKFNLIKLELYLTTLGIICTIVGIIFAISDRPKKETCFFLGIALFFAIFYIHKSAISLDHPWWVRRYLPIVIPSFMIFVGVAIDKIKKNVRYGNVMSIIILSILIFSYLDNDKIILNYVEKEGIIEQTQNISNYIGNDSIIIFMRDKGKYVGSYSSTPIKYIFDKTALWIEDDPSSYYRLIDIIKNWKNEGKDVYIVFPTDNFSYELSKYYKLSHTIFPVNYNSLVEQPKFSSTQIFGYRIYRMTPLNPPSKGYYNLTIYKLKYLEKSDSILIDVGQEDTGRTKGFYGKEKNESGITFRWTPENVEINVPDVNGNVILVEIGSYAWRPSSIIPNVSFAINDNNVEKYNLNIDKDFEYYNFTINKSETDPLKIKIHADTWNPHNFGSQDNRDLGIAIDWIKVKKIE